MAEHIFLYKQAIAVRGDLEMSSGKLGTQCSHAAVGGYKNADSLKREAWFDEGFRKIVLRVDGVLDILRLQAKCIELGVPHYVVYDFGLTELDPSTLTCIGIGPDLNDNVDKITKRLKLWKQ